MECEICITEPSRFPLFAFLFINHRDVGDGLYEMEGKVMIDSNLLKNQAPLHYKYLVHSPQRSEESVSPYEFLHGAPAPYWGQKVVDRKIFIPTSKFATKGEAIFHE